jgi:3-isopropylmalate/(R)-2-methylmalate dehydratase small subunit
VISGKVWKFGDDINTDLMLPGPLLFATEEKQKRAVFSANRPGWVDQVRTGDIIVGGLNYGMGSSRPAARSLRNLGIAALLAESINGLFFRNAVNFGLLPSNAPEFMRHSKKGKPPRCRLTTSRCATLISVRG